MRTSTLLISILVASRESLCRALLTSPSVRPFSSAPSRTFVNPDVTSITEELCLDAARRMQRIPVPVSKDIHLDGKVDVSFIHWETEKSSRVQLKPPPLILIHGFDSSCLEYRRLGGLLAQRGIETYAVDLLGWGFSQLEDVRTFSAEAKLRTLSSFIDTVLGPNAVFCIAGASLGGAAAIETTVARQTDRSCRGLILLDAQGFVDGIGIMSKLPAPLAKLGVGVLKSVALRSSANQMSYFDKAAYATDDAVKVGRIHCLREGWDDALVSFMQSGGFAPSRMVPQIQVPSLILWGRQDEILQGEEFANKFLDTLPDGDLQWIEECGHVPHLEQPQRTADAIAKFLHTRIVSGSRQGSMLETVAYPPFQLVGSVGVAGIAAGIAAYAFDFLAVH